MIKNYVSGLLQKVQKQHLEDERLRTTREEKRLKNWIKHAKVEHQNEIQSIHHDYFGEIDQKNKRIVELELELGRANRKLNRPRAEKGVQSNALEDRIEAQVSQIRDELY